MKSSKEPVVVQMNGKTFRLIEPSTKVLDSKLKKASRLRALSIITGLRKATGEAKRRGVPLSEILPVS